MTKMPVKLGMRFNIFWNCFDVWTSLCKLKRLSLKCFWEEKACMASTVKPTQKLRPVSTTEVTAIAVNF